MGSKNAYLGWLVFWLIACGGPQESGKRTSHNTSTSQSDGGAKDAGKTPTATCASAGCGDHASCDDSSSKPVCTCKPGYDGDGKSCTDIDECATNNGGCGANATCTNMPGSFRCDCAAGFTSTGGQQCMGLCEMALADSSQCGSNARCTVEKSGAVCDQCKAGFVGDGKTCTDHHTECPAECNGGVGSDTNAVCKENAGKYSCACAAGYDGTPGSCKDIDECAAGTDSCNHDTGKCIDTEGGYSCACKDGYKGDGTTCTDVDECKDAKLYDCPKNSTCVNDVGSYHCACKGDFAGDDPKACYCDLSGYWAMRQDSTTCWDARTQNGVTFIAKGVAQATVWELHRYTYDGNTLKLETQGCGDDQEPDLVSPVLKETYSSFIPQSVFLKLGFQPGTDSPAPGLVPGSSFSTADQVGITGIDLGSDPANAPWPAHSSEVNPPGGAPPAWVDTDGDGEPGFTFWPKVPSQHTLPTVNCSDCPANYSYLPSALSSSNGTVTVDKRAGCVSTGTRVVSKIEGTISDKSCTDITGMIIGIRGEGRLYSATSVPKDRKTDITCDAADWSAMARCGADEINALDGQDQTNFGQTTFELVKIGTLSDHPDCGAVKAALPVIPRSGPLDTCPF